MSFLLELSALSASYPALPLREFNTFGFAVTARLGAVAGSEAALRAIIMDSRLVDVPRLVMGGGSNLVLTRDFEGLALRIVIPGRRLVAVTEQAYLVEAGAGENWHAFVDWTLEQGYPGLENLALIPGTVGAGPVQNIGAYGLELQQRFHSLRAMDTRTGEIVAFDADACRFAYRDSFFKGEGRDRYIITAVTFALPRRWEGATAYADLQQALSEANITAPQARDIFNAVVAVRKHKLPDPARVGNAGSFFKNPIVDATQYEALRAKAPDVVGYAQSDGRVKLAAAWLIDQCGWKGRALGRAAVHARQALVLINPGSATGTDVMLLANAIADDVASRFGVTLEIEPLVL